MPDGMVRIHWRSNTQSVILEWSESGGPTGSLPPSEGSVDETAMFVGDVVHHPTQIYRPEWNSIFCEDPEQARETRREVLELAASREALLVPAHFGGSHMARVLRERSGFRPVLNPL